MSDVTKNAKIVGTMLPFKGAPGKLYRPSNGTEGGMFMARWCERCENDRAWREREECPCRIMCNAFCWLINEWHYDANGIPVCDAFQFDPESKPDTDPMLFGEAP